MARYVTAGGGTSSAVDHPTVVILDDVGYSDAQTMAWTFQDDIGSSDAQSWALGFTDDLGFSDSGLAITGTPRFSDYLGWKDTGTFIVTNWQNPRSGTTDTNPFGDGWVDSLVANNGVNHGNESPLPIDGALLSATQNDAFMEFDLTRFTGLSAPTGATMTLSIHAVQGLAVAQTFSTVFSKFASRPFTESTLNFTNKPADGTSAVTKSVSVLVGTVPANYDVTLTAAEYGPYLGSWMMARFSSTAVLATPINISSREDTTAANRPALTFTASL